MMNLAKVDGDDFFYDFYYKVVSDVEIQWRYRLFQLIYDIKQMHAFDSFIAIYEKL